jgi:hypothetical protein
MSTFGSVKFLTEHFSDTSRVSARLRAAGVANVPDEETVRKWVKRGKVSDAQVLNLLFCLEKERGAPVALSPYFEAGA